MRKLRVDEIDFRVGTIGKSSNGAYCTLLAYKDARVDMAILDEIFGQGLWQNEYKRDTKGVLQCGIAVHYENVGWVWKWSNGTESNTEKEKGEYSDAFKRAGFMWGIGRELYDVPTLFVNMNQDEYFEKDAKIRQTAKFKPNEWNWEITEQHVKATDASGQRVFAKFGRGSTVAPKQVTQPKPQPKVVPKAERIIVSEGDETFLKIVKAVSEGKATIQQAIDKYSISEDVEASLKDKIQLLAQIV